MAQSTCCFESPITKLGVGQYWVNISVIESDLSLTQDTFSMAFGSVYHFPPPIAIDNRNQPAACRLMNPTDIDKGSEWTCVGKAVKFRVDTTPYNQDPIVTQLSTNASGTCKGQAFCPLLTDVPAIANATGIENTQISLGLLGTYDRGPVIASFTLVGLFLVGLAAALYYRNRNKKSEDGSTASASSDPTQKPFSLYHFIMNPCLPSKKNKRSISSDTLRGKKKRKTTVQEKSKTKEPLVKITPPLPGSKLMKTATQKKESLKSLKPKNPRFTNPLQPNFLQVLHHRANPQSRERVRGPLVQVDDPSRIGSQIQSFGGSSFPSRSPQDADIQSEDSVPLGVLYQHPSTM